MQPNPMKKNQLKTPEKESPALQAGIESYSLKHIWKNRMLEQSRPLVEAYPQERVLPENGFLVYTTDKNEGLEKTIYI